MLRSLLLSRDDGTIRIVTRCFRNLDVELEHCPEIKAALQKASEVRYDAIVIDDEIEDARKALARMLELPTCGKSVRIALVESDIKMDAIFKSGTQVILYKPLSTDRVRHGLRAVRNLMARERRQGAERVPTTIAARLTPRGKRGSARPVVITDLSESGAAITFEGKDLPASALFGLDFALPDNPERMHASVALMWRNNEGAAGLHFVDIASYTRKQLMDWLKEHASQQKVQAAAAGRK